MEKGRQRRSSKDLVNCGLDFLRLCRVAKPCDRITLAVEDVAAVKIPCDSAREFGLADLDDRVGIVTIDVGAFGDDELLGSCESKGLNFVGCTALLPEERVAGDSDGDKVSGGVFVGETFEKVVTGVCVAAGGGDVDSEDDFSRKGVRGEGVSFDVV